MDRRKEPRFDLEFSVRIWGVDRNARPFAEVVRATSVSPTGAVLLDVHSKLHAGEIIDVQHEARRAQFRIVWTEKPESRRCPANLRFLQLYPRRLRWRELGRP